MPNQVTAAGLETETQSELLASLTASFESIYGADINLASDSPDGELINVFIQVVLDNLDLLTQIYNGFDPDQAIGVVLDQRCALNGIQRQAGTYTTTNIAITVDQSLTLKGLDSFSVDEAFTVSDDQGNKWILTITQNPAIAGTNSYVFRAEFPGAVTTTPNTITVPVTVVLGVTDINNPTTYIQLGLNEETDAELRLRRQKSVSLASQGYLAGLLAALENINGVTSAFVYENVTGATDGDNVPGHSIWPITSGTPTDVLTAYSSGATYNKGDFVSSGGNAYGSIVDNNIGNLVSDVSVWRNGGLVSEFPIARAIYTKRNAGCGMFGAESFIYTQVDGSPFEVNWDVVADEDLYIKFNVSSLDGVNPPNDVAIKAGLVSGPNSLSPGVFEQMNVNMLATKVQAIDPNALLTVTASTQGFGLTALGTYYNSLFPSAKNKKFAVAAGRITITVV